jgi:hypothetical protein
MGATALGIAHADRLIIFVRRRGSAHPRKLRIEAMTHRPARALRTKILQSSA